MTTVKKLFFLLIVISAFWLVIKKQDLEVPLDLLSIQQWFQLIGLQLLTMALIHIQWARLSKQIELQVSQWHLLTVNMLGNCVDFLTPSMKAGSELTKVVWLNQNTTITKEKATSLVLIQKSISMTVFILIAAYSCFTVNIDILSSVTHHNGPLYFTGLLFVLVAMVIVIKKFKNKIKPFIDQLCQHFRRLFARPYFMVEQVLLSVVVWLIFPYKLSLLLDIYDIKLSISVIIGVTFISYTVGMLPLLPGGIGSFESTLVLLLRSLGISYTISIAIALLFRFITYWLQLVISLLYLLGGRIVKWYLSKKSRISSHYVT
ncbi:lysylphosphatidylglycerol synthase transmembrane domain-containing protein [Amphibacillus jilinensis]|uniref:lysylphosphatidylglycerol synthase transmembrane domain-containing protein n=1 Tax=Amphibacillus jilinensis TaxID=1216008 RepID=UPI00030AC07E|nr:lysylphosphatidylglycerol synthase transmembrane domain-containing protein [Amphibacillus jilinensis]